jgi:hypothetical protein
MCSSTRQHLRQRERGGALNQRARRDRQRQPLDQLGLALRDDVVEEVLDRSRQDEARDGVDHHEDQAQHEPSAARPDEGLGLLRRDGPADFLFLDGISHGRAGHGGAIKVYPGDSRPTSETPAARE